MPSLRGDGIFSVGKISDLELRSQEKDGQQLRGQSHSVIADDIGEPKDIGCSSDRQAVPRSRGGDHLSRN